VVAPPDEALAPNADIGDFRQVGSAEQAFRPARLLRKKGQSER